MTQLTVIVLDEERFELSRQLGAENWSGHGAEKGHGAGSNTTKHGQ